MLINQLVTINQEVHYSFVILVFQIFNTDIYKLKRSSPFGDNFLLIGFIDSKLR